MPAATYSIASLDQFGLGLKSLNLVIMTSSDYGKTLYTEGISFSLDNENGMIYHDSSTNPFDVNLGTWFFEKVPNTQNHFRIRTKKSGEYLFAGTDLQTNDPERRNVFVWIGASRTTGNMELNTNLER
jgi:hypothetical protein